MHRCMLPLTRRSSRRLRFHSTLAGDAAREDPRWPGWRVVVGIEVHAQVKSRKKLFSSEHRIPWVYRWFTFPRPTSFPKALGRMIRLSLPPLGFRPSTLRSREPYQFVFWVCFRPPLVQILACRASIQPVFPLGFEPR